MATAKTTTLTFRIEPGLKEALRTAAARAPIHCQHGGGVDSGLLRAEWDCDPQQGAPFENDLRLPAEAPAGERGRKA